MIGLGYSNMQKMTIPSLIVDRCLNDDSSKQIPIVKNSRHLNFILTTLLLALLTANCAAEPFPGEKTDFHGCALYSVQIGGETAQVLVPEKPAAGRPWVLASQLYNLNSATLGNMTRTEIELVKRGFHVVVLGLGNTFGDLPSG